MINKTEVELKAKLWLANDKLGEVVREADKLLGIVNNHRHMIKETKTAMIEAERIHKLQMEIESKRLAVLEQNLVSANDAYLYLRDLIVPPKPAPKPVVAEVKKPFPPKVEEKKKIKKTKLVEVEEEE